MGKLEGGSGKYSGYELRVAGNEINLINLINPIN
jgi:hypothetical protein